MSDPLPLPKKTLDYMPVMNTILSNWVDSSSLDAAKKPASGVALPA
jgi:hypothetical protein